MRKSGFSAIARGIQQVPCCRHVHGRGEAGAVDDFVVVGAPADALFVCGEIGVFHRRRGRKGGLVVLGQVLGRHGRLGGLGHDGRGGVRRVLRRARGHLAEHDRGDDRLLFAVCTLGVGGQAAEPPTRRLPRLKRRGPDEPGPPRHRVQARPGRDQGGPGPRLQGRRRGRVHGGPHPRGADAPVGRRRRGPRPRLDVRRRRRRPVHRPLLGAHVQVGHFRRVVLRPESTDGQGLSAPVHRPHAHGPLLLALRSPRHARQLRPLLRQRRALRLFGLAPRPQGESRLHRRQARRQVRPGRIDRRLPQHTVFTQSPPPLHGTHGSPPPKARRLVRVVVKSYNYTRPCAICRARPGRSRGCRAG